MLPRQGDAYYHDPHCAANRLKPMGTLDCSCWRPRLARAALFNRERGVVLDLEAEWLRHRGFPEAAETLLMLRQGDLTEEDIAWADAKIRALMHYEERGSGTGADDGSWLEV